MENQGKKEFFSKKEAWDTKDAALKGVLPKEQEEYGKSREDCWRCGRNGHKTFECFSFNTIKGTVLPKAPWSVSAVTQGKRMRSEKLEEPPIVK